MRHFTVRSVLHYKYKYNTTNIQKLVSVRMKPPLVFESLRGIANKITAIDLIRFPIQIIAYKLNCIKSKFCIIWVHNNW